MAERENEMDQAIDPPDNQGGGNEAMNLESASEEPAAIDPPSNDGGN